MRPKVEVDGLVEDNMGLVYAVARRNGWLRWGDDLIQCGYEGLAKAAIHWAEQGKFASYASRCIETEMRKYIRGELKHRAHNISVPDVRGGTYTVEERMISRIDTRTQINHAHLSDRARAVLRGIAAGKSREEIACEVGVSVRHVGRIVKSAGRQMNR